MFNEAYISAGIYYNAVMKDFCVNFGTCLKKKINEMAIETDFIGTIFKWLNLKRI